MRNVALNTATRMRSAFWGHYIAFWGLQLLCSHDPASALSYWVLRLHMRSGKFAFTCRFGSAFCITHIDYKIATRIRIIEICILHYQTACNVLLVSCSFYQSCIPFRASYSHPVVVIQHFDWKFTVWNLIGKLFNVFYYRGGQVRSCIWIQCEIPKGEKNILLEHVVNSKAEAGMLGIAEHQDCFWTQITKGLLICFPLSVSHM